MSKVYVFLAQGFEEIEALTVVDLLRRAKIDVSTVSITAEHAVTGSHRIPVTADLAIGEADFAACDMIVLPGGIPGTPNLEASAPLMAALDDFHANGKYISAICAAPSIFAHKGYLKGLDACCNPSFEEHLTAGGAHVLHQNVVVSGNIIMSRAMGTAADFGLAIIERFQGREAAETMSRKILHS